jgi:branched-chain amino acid transport system substrate-binding protein
MVKAPIPIRRISTALIGVAALALAACSSSGSSGSSPAAAGTPAAAAVAAPAIHPVAKWPATIPITAVADLTGSAGGALSIQTVDGLKLGLQQINSELTGTQVSLSMQDSQSTATTAAQLTTAAVAGSAVAIIGPSLSSEAVAAAPIAARANVPYLGMQFSPTGVITAGTSTFDAVPATAPLEYLIGKYLQKLGGVKKVAIVYDSDVPTTVGLNSVIKSFGPTYGFSVTDSVPVTLNQVDYTSVATQLASGGFDAIGIMAVQSQNSSIAQQLIRAGFKGKLFSDVSACCGTLNPLGASANGISWVSDFTQDMSGTASAAFVKQWRAAYGTSLAPTAGAAEAYDLMLFLGQGIGKAPTPDRAGLLQGLSAVTQSGFTGAEGPVTFADRGVSVKGVVIAWENGKETLGLQGS